MIIILNGEYFYVKNTQLSFALDCLVLTPVALFMFSCGSCLLTGQDRAISHVRSKKPKKETERCVAERNKRQQNLEAWLANQWLFSKSKQKEIALVVRPGRTLPQHSCCKTRKPRLFPLRLLWPDKNIKHSPLHTFIVNSLNSFLMAAGILLQSTTGITDFFVVGKMSGILYVYTEWKLGQKWCQKNLSEQIFQILPRTPDFGHFF